MPPSSGPIDNGPAAWRDLPRRLDSPLSRKSAQGMSLYPQERLYQEMAFLAYYLHWSNDALMELDHWERRRWCREVSAINQKLSGNEKKSFELK